MIWCLINILVPSKIKSLFENSVLFRFVMPQWNFINLGTDSAKGYVGNVYEKGICRAVQWCIEDCRGILSSNREGEAGFVHLVISFKIWFTDGF